MDAYTEGSRQDSYIDGIHRIELIGSCARFTFYSESVELDGTQTRVIHPVRFVIQIDRLPSAIKQATACVTQAALRAVKKSTANI